MVMAGFSCVTATLEERANVITKINRTGSSLWKIENGEGENMQYKANELLVY